MSHASHPNNPPKQAAALQRRSRPPALRIHSGTEAGEFGHGESSKPPSTPPSQAKTVERIGRCRIVVRNARYYVRWYQPRKRLNSNQSSQQSQVGDQPHEGPFNTLAEARARARLIAREQEKGEYARGGPGMLEVMAATEGQVVGDPKLAAKTISAYKARWQYLRTFINQTAPRIAARKITQSFVAAFERWLIGQEVSPNGRADGRKGPISPRQQKNILEAAGTLWRKAQQFGLVAADIPNPFRCGSHGRRLNSQKFPGFEEGRFDRHLVGDFLDACDEWQRKIFLLMLALGLRSDELRHMMIEKIDWKNHVYILDPMVEELGWNTKSGKWRLLPILPELEPLFSEFIGNRRTAGVLVLDKPIILESRAGLLETPSLQAMCALYRELLGKHGDQGRRHASAQVQERLSEEVFLRAGALQRKRIYTEFQAVLKKLDVGKALWPHLTRGFAVSRAHQSGVDRFVALSVIGHASQATFDRYCEHDAAFVQKEWAKVLDGNSVILDALAKLTPPPGKNKA